MGSHGTERADRQAAVMDAVQALHQVHTEMHRILASTPNQQVSLAEMLVLHQVAHSKATTPGQIMAATGLTSGGVTSLIDRLEKKGLVTRRRSTEDRRVVTVTLAPEAKKKMGTLMQAAHKEAARLFEGWSATRIRALVRSLQALSARPSE